MELKSAIALNKLELWNKAGKDCISYCEKRTKDWLEDNHLLSENLERTHNLKALFRAIPNYDKELYKLLAAISGYYFETVYPGDNAIFLNADDVSEAIEICHLLNNYLEDLVNDKQEDIQLLDVAQWDKED